MGTAARRTTSAEDAAEQPAAGPKKAVETLDLVKRFDQVWIGVGRHEAIRLRPVHTARLQVNQIADFPVLDAREKLLPGLAVPAHQPHAHL